MIIKDGDWTLFDHDFAMGRTIWHMFDGQKDVFRVDQNVTSLVSENESVRNIASKTWTGDWHRVASIPLNIAHDHGLMEAHKQGDHAFVDRYLNDGDNRAWRTKDGVL
jgi:hypothetical protein